MAADEKGPPKTGEKAGAGGRSAGRRAKAPVTIDLEANASEAAAAAVGAPAAEVDEATETGAAEQPPPSAGLAPKMEKPAASGLLAAPVWPRPLELAVAAGAGGLIVLLLGFGLQGAGVLPVPGRSAADAALTEADRVSGTVSGLDQRVTAIESASAQAIADRALLDDLAKRVGVVDAFGTSLSDRLLNAEASIAALKDGVGGKDETATRQDLDNLAKRVQRLETMDGGAASGTPGQRIAAIEAELATLQSLGGRVDVLAAQVDGLGAKVDALSAAPGVASTTQQAARAAAIAALRQAAAAGGAFGDDLAMAGALGVGGSEMAALKPLAAKGVPSPAELAAEFPAVAEAILAAEPESGGSGFFDRIVAYGHDLVKIRPAGPVAGDDPAAVVSRMRAAVDSGDLAAALEERKALPAAGQAASQDWADAAADRIEIERLVDAITAPAGAGRENGQANSG